jgi:hypothetical protein
VTSVRVEGVGGAQHECRHNRPPYAGTRLKCVMAGEQATQNESALLSLLQRSLKTAGFDVTITTRLSRERIHYDSPHAFVIILGRGRPDAIDALSQLCSAGYEVPVIIVSSRTAPSTVTPNKLGAVQSDESPITPAQLRVDSTTDLVPSCMSLPVAPVTSASGLTRWATAVASILDLARDPKTITAWARAQRVAPATLRTWCQTAGLPAKASLDLGRIIRAVHIAKRTSGAIAQHLDVSHPRTLNRLLTAAGLTSSQPVSLTTVLAVQAFVNDPAAIHELSRALKRSSNS